MKALPSMTTLVAQYLSLRHGLGFKLESADRILGRFARYADAHGRRTITVEFVSRWATETTPSRGSRARQLEVIRPFAHFCAARNSRTEVPPSRLFGPGHRRRAPHIYSDAEVNSLLDASSRLKPRDGLRPRTYVTLFGLLASSGLRVMEALRLGRLDADLSAGILTIRGTKFRKSRLVPLHPSTVVALSTYAEHRRRALPGHQGDSFLQDDRGEPLKHSNVFGTFERLRDRLGWTRRGSEPPRRIHDLRHTFAVRRVASWYAQGVDVNAKIAALATYLGHVKVSDTYWYLTAVPELMALAASRFETFAANCLETP